MTRGGGRAGGFQASGEKNSYERVYVEKNARGASELACAGVSQGLRIYWRFTPRLAAAPRRQPGTWLKALGENLYGRMRTEQLFSTSLNRFLPHLPQPTAQSDKRAKAGVF